jgi:hypothetical protein
LWLGVDVYYTLIRGRFGLRAGTWREGVAANFWLRHYKQSPAVVSGGDKYAAWFADLDALPSRWEMDRAWAKVNGLPFDERPHYYGRVVGWEVAAWVVGGLLVVLALTALLDPEAMDVALTLGFFGAVFCALARKLDTMRRRLS